MIEALERATNRTFSRETYERLRVYERLLRAEASRQNLVSASTLESLWDRHILDSAQLVRFEPHEGAAWADIGSGAGLPGIVLACLVRGPVTLIEPRRLRADFLHRLVVALGLQASVIQKKAESADGEFDAITGRAVAPLTAFLDLSRHLSTGKTRFILPKGRNAESELDEARKTWQGMFHVERSVTDVESRIIIAERVRRRRDDPDCSRKSEGRRR